MKISMFDEIQKVIATGSPAAIRFLNGNFPVLTDRRLLNLIVNRILASSLLKGHLDFFEGKTLALSITDINKDYYFKVIHRKVESLTYLNTPSIHFKASMNALVLLASQKADPDTLFFKRQLTILGDTELGLMFKSFIENLDHDCLPKGLISPLKWHADAILTWDDSCC